MASVRLAHRHCLIAGGGRVAERRCLALLGAGAKVSVVAPEIAPAISASAAQCHQRPFEDADLDGAEWVVAATDDAGLNRAIAAKAKARGLLVNVASAAGEGNLIFPAAVRRGDLAIGVSSGGRLPALSRHLADELGARYGPGWARIVDMLAAQRQRVARAGASARERVGFWRRLLSGPFVELALGGCGPQAESLLQAELRRLDEPQEKAPGCVFLVGAGPGDYRLLTLRAFEILSRADVVLYDRLVSAEILACIPPEARRINVGKESQRPSLGQQPINEMMVEMARKGLTVARLKGGDPFVFGRGGEEIEELAGSGIVFEVVPGISAANGCACYYGIPLTHRDYAHSCVLMTAHRRQDAPDIDWRAVARPRQTLVLYMGNYRLGEVARALRDNGLGDQHPLALISCGTMAQEKTYIGTLGEVIECPPALDSPTLAIVGEVVRLSHRLNWRQRKHSPANDEGNIQAGAQPDPPAD